MRKWYHQIEPSTLAGETELKTSGHLPRRAKPKHPRKDPSALASGFAFFHFSTKFPGSRKQYLRRQLERICCFHGKPLYASSAFSESSVLLCKKLSFHHRNSRVHHRNHAQVQWRVLRRSHAIDKSFFRKQLERICCFHRKTLYASSAFSESSVLQCK